MLPLMEGAMDTNMLTWFLPLFDLQGVSIPQNNQMPREPLDPVMEQSDAG